jgi:uncharacterized protein YabN with tetrapyrrole methylase and pyrophosphatase domain
MTLTSGPAIYLLGSGVYSFFDLTLRTQYLLQECRQVFFLHDLPSLERYLARLTPEPENLMPLYYLEGRDRSEIYDDITRHVVEAARRAPPVALLMHGHPLVYSSISERIIAQGERESLAVSVEPGVSSLDRIFVDLGLDIATRGIQILHASAAITEKTVLNPQVDALFFQMGSILDNTSKRQRAVDPEQVRPFQEYLLHFYPPSQRVKIVECAVEIGFHSRITETPLERLFDAAPSFNYNASAYVPAVGAD